MNMEDLQHLKETRGLHLKTKRNRNNIHKSAFYSVVIFGDKYVGKTSLIRRLMDNIFVREYIPTVDEVYEKTLPGDLNETFRIYDTAGSIDFPAMNRLTISKSDACIIVFSVDNLKSLQYAERKFEEVMNIKGNDFPCVLVGNKCDVKERQVSETEGTDCSVKYSATYEELSVKNEENIDHLLFTLLDVIKMREYQKHGREKIYSRLSAIKRR